METNARGSLRVLFAGTPAFAVPSLRAVASRFPVVGVLTNPDAPRGRGRRLQSPPVKEEALRLGLRVFQPERLDAAFREQVARLAPDILVVVAYGKIFGPKFLALFPKGGINLHPSLLPKYRGPAPIPAAILNLEPETGITVQKLDLRMDAGDIILQERISLTGRETSESLSLWASERGAELLVEALHLIEEGKATPVPQDETAATYCALLKKEDGLILWEETAVRIDAKVRAFYPWPRAYTSLNQHRLYLLETVPLEDREADASPGTVAGVDKDYGILIQTGKGLLGVLKLQREGRNPLGWKEFLNGMPDLVGLRLGGTGETTGP